MRNVTEVRLSLNGGVEEVADLADEPVRTPRINQRPVVSDGAAFGFLATSGEEIVAIDGLSDQVVALDPTGASLGPGGDSAAVRSADGVSIVRVRRGPGAARSAGGTRGARDRRLRGRLVGSGRRARRARLVRRRRRGHPDLRTVDRARASPRSRCRATRPASSRSSATAPGRGSSPRRSSATPTATPSRLGPVPLNLADVAGVPLDVTWLDSRTVGSIAEAPGGGARVVKQEVGGRADATDGPTGAREIVGRPTACASCACSRAPAPSSRGRRRVAGQATGIRFLAPQQPD